MFRKMRRLDMKMSDEETKRLLKRGREGVLSTISDNGYPYGVVVNYVYYNEKIYFHCAKNGHKLDNIRKNNKVSFTVYDNVEIVGEKLNTLYQSLIIFGKAKVLDGNHEILTALVNKYAELPEKIVEKMILKEVDMTAIVEIEIDHITGKKSE